jgi:hypothetical protein
MDKTSKIILAVAAAGLWANALIPITRPAQAQAEMSRQAQAEMSRIALDVQTVAHSLDTLVKGGLDCGNRRLCER